MIRSVPMIDNVSAINTKKLDLINRFNFEFTRLKMGDLFGFCFNRNSNKYYRNLFKEAYYDVLYTLDEQHDEDRYDTYMINLKIDDDRYMHIAGDYGIVINELNYWDDKYGFSRRARQYRKEIKKLNEMKTLINSKDIRNGWYNIKNFPPNVYLYNNYKEALKIKKVEWNIQKKTGYPCTVVYWDDGTVTSVICNTDTDTFSVEVGIMACYMKKMFGNNGHYNQILHKYEKQFVKDGWDEKIGYGADGCKVESVGLFDKFFEGE